jgi:hypothetical protein
VTAFENMEAKRLLDPLSDETIEEMGEKQKFYNRRSITSDKTKKNVSWPGAQHASVKQQTCENTPQKFSGDLGK